MRTATKKGAAGATGGNYKPVPARPALQAQATAPATSRSNKNPARPPGGGGGDAAARHPKARLQWRRYHHGLGHGVTDTEATATTITATDHAATDHAATDHAATDHAALTTLLPTMLNPPVEKNTCSNCKTTRFVILIS
jgi:hypothetical protein